MTQNALYKDKYFPIEINSVAFAGQNAGFRNYLIVCLLLLFAKQVFDWYRLDVPLHHVSRTVSSMVKLHWQIDRQAHSGNDI